MSADGIVNTGRVAMNDLLRLKGPSVDEVELLGRVAHGWVSGIGAG